MSLQVPGGEEAEAVTTTPSSQVVGTLDVELMLNRLLSFKDNPGKQVHFIAAAPHVYTYLHPQQIIISNLL